jgi:coenzyme F420-reducing hydrogenase delta subunit
MQTDYNPRIWVFLCDCCLSYPAFEKSALGLGFPTSILKIDEMCISEARTGQVRMAFEKGADGVLLCGCQLGNCKQGNNVARLQLIHSHQRLLREMGLDPRRLGQEFLGPGTRKTLYGAVARFLGRIGELGPARPRTLKEKASEV